MSTSHGEDLEDAQDDLRLKTKFVALKEREIKVQQETIEAGEARKAELEGALEAYKGVLAATEGLLHVVREGGDLLAEQDKIIADLGAAVEKCPAPLREEPQGKAERLFADLVAIHAAMVATDDILSSMMDSPSLHK